MGMSIDDAIKHIGQARYDYCEYWEETRNDTTIAFDIAMDTMRKYKKIQELMAGWYNFNSYEILCAMYKVNLLIGEVAEDGNDDCN